MSDQTNRDLVQQNLIEEFNLGPMADKMDFLNHLALKINELIIHDFEKLVQILYRIDIDEIQLREMISKYVHEDAGYIIAQLVVDRQLQKFESRKQFKKDENIPEGDKW